MLDWTPIRIDTESDGFHGRMLSIALVTGSGASFYGVLPPMHMIGEWAIEHIRPVLGSPTHMDYIVLAEDLSAWLCQFPAAEIIADWHRDLVHFFGFLGPRPGHSSSPVHCALA
jgi:hypothetical protein